jgi:hypothetical protein
MTRELVNVVPTVAAPIFIGGINRSGTSLVRGLLASHPQVAIPPTEFEFFKRFQGASRARLSPQEARSAAAEMLAWPKVAAWDLDAESVLERVESGEPSPRGLFVAFLEAYAAAAGKPRLGEKTTYYHRNLKTFDHWFGRGYAFVHVLRHPVSSFASARWYGGTERKLDPRGWSLDWLESALIAARRARRQRGYLAVRYEDLVGDPEGQTRLMCEGLGIEFEPAMLELDEFPERDNSSFEPAGAGYVGKVRQADAVDRASLLTQAELAEVRRITGAVASAIGYDLDDEHALGDWKPSGSLSRSTELTASTRHKVTVARRRLDGALHGRT